MEEANDEQRIKQAVQEKTKTLPSMDTNLRWLHDQIVERFGSQLVSLREFDIHQHAADLSSAKPCPPDLIFYPEDVYQIKWLLEHVQPGVRVVPYGKGTSVEGQTVPCGPAATVSLDMHRMRRVLSYNQAGLSITVEAGLDLKALNTILEEDGLWFPVDPMANATIGGMIASNAEGLSSLRYGEMAENVSSLKVVLANGTELILSHQQFFKNIFIGSEGIFGIVVEATLELQPVAKDTKTVWCSFSRLEEAALAVPRVIREQKGLIRCFLLDGPAIRSINIERKTSFTECPSMLLQLQSEASVILKESPEVTQIAESTNIWCFLGDAWFLGENPVGTTVKVPRDRIAEIIRQVHRDGDQGCCILCNAATGTVIILKPSDQVEQLCEDIFPVVKHVGGSLSGYGMGPSKLAWMQSELEPSLSLLKGLKNLLDPRDILGPGKLHALL